MVYLKLYNGKELSFNLKDGSTEQNLRNAWWAMSDMEAYRNKQLKIHTDQDENYTFKIHEIILCIVTPEKLIHKDNLTIESPDIKTTRVSESEEPAPKSEEDKLVELLLPGSGNLNKTFREMMVKSLSRFPQKQKSKLLKFYVKVKSLDSIKILLNTAFVNIVGQLLADNSDEIDKYVDMYIEYYKSNIKD